MSVAYFETGGLRTWNEDEIDFREYCVQVLKSNVEKSLLALNRSWQFVRVEAPILTASQRLSGNYTDDDVFMLKAMLGGEEFCLRPETTPTSYAVAKHLLKQSKPPLCVWQAGKSFRREVLDGASPSKLRYNEFWQLEFQCIYAKTTMADYRTAVENACLKQVEILLGQVRLVESDRLPSYSSRTTDIEVFDNERTRYFEVASISTRTDFDENMEVLEIAFGLDRLVELRGLG